MSLILQGLGGNPVLQGFGSVGSPTPTATISPTPTPTMSTTATYNVASTAVVFTPTLTAGNGSSGADVFLAFAAADAGLLGKINALSAGLSSLAPLASAALTGTPTAPTAAAGTNTAQVATTAFVHGAVATVAGLVGLLGISQNSSSGKFVSLILQGGNNYPDGLFQVDDANHRLVLGDIAGDMKGTFVEVNDATGIVSINATNGVDMSGGGFIDLSAFEFIDGSKINKSGGKLTYTDPAGHLTTLATDA